MANRRQGSDAIRTADAFSRWAQGDQLRKGGGRVPEEWRQILRRDPFMRDVVMVADLQFGGARGGYQIRVCSVPLESQSGLTGLDHDAHPVLLAEPEIDHSYRVGTATSSARSVTLTVDARVVDAPELIRQGNMLSGLGELALEEYRSDRVTQVPADYDRRLVLIRGDLGGGSTFGAARLLARVNGEDREVVELEIVDPRDSVGAKVPPWVIDTRRFSAPHESAVGERIPIVINGFNDIPAVRVTSNTTGEQRFVYAVGRGPFTVDDVKVNGVSYASGHGTYGWTAETDTDNEGLAHSRIRFTNGATVWDDSDAVHVTVTADDEAFDPVEVIREMCTRYSPFGSQGIEESLFAEASTKLTSRSPPNVLVNAASGGSSSSAMEWAENGFLSSFPMISMVWERGGYGPVVTDWRTHPVAQWTAGEAPLLDRAMLVQESPKSEIRNEFVLRYGYDPVLDVFEEVLVRGADNDAVCSFSQDLVGGARHADPIESVYIRDNDQAQYVIDWLVTHLALPSYYVEYDAMPRVLLQRRRGDTILLSDDDFGWVDERATVERIAYRRGRATIGLRVWTRFMDLGGGAFSVIPSGE